MLPQSRNKSIKRAPMREVMEDRLYLTKKSRPVSDDDIVIDFDDDVGGIDVDYSGYQPKRDNPNVPTHGSNLRHSDNDLQAALVDIQDRLAGIENMLQKALSGGSSQKVTVTAQQETAPVSEALASGDIMSRLRPPRNVVPEGSMLGEIQSVLAQQASMAGDAGQQAAGAADTSGICTLPQSAYDDDVPDIIVD